MLQPVPEAGRKGRVNAWDETNKYQTLTTQQMSPVHAQLYTPVNNQKLFPPQSTISNVSKISQSRAGTKSKSKSAKKKDIHPSQVGYRTANRQLKEQLQQQRDQQGSQLQEQERLRGIIGDHQQVIENQVKQLQHSQALLIEDLREDIEQRKSKEAHLLSQLTEQASISKSALEQLQHLQANFSDTKRLLTTDIETLLQDKEQMKIDLEQYYRRRYDDKLDLKLQQVYAETKRDLALQYEQKIHHLTKELREVYDENDRLQRKLLVYSYRDKEEFHSAVKQDKYSTRKDPTYEKPVKNRYDTTPLAKF